MENNILTLPGVEKNEYERNFISLAVCELKFPTLLEYETKEPVKFQMAIRKEYPHYQKGKNYNIQAGAEHPVSETVYTFLSKKKDWTVAFKPSSISLETKQYTNFTEFKKRIIEIIDKSKKIIDTDFYTRLGIRYIDILPINSDSIDEWINPELTNPLICGKHGMPEQYWQEVVGQCESGKYIFRHGIRNNKHNEYVLDFDFYTENIEIKEAESKIVALHDESIKLFFWSLNEKSKHFMKGEDV